MTEAKNTSPMSFSNNAVRPMTLEKPLKWFPACDPLNPDLKVGENEIVVGALFRRLRQLFE